MWHLLTPINNIQGNPGMSVCLSTGYLAICLWFRLLSYSCNNVCHILREVDTDTDSKLGFNACHCFRMYTVGVHLNTVSMLFISTTNNRTEK